MSCLRRFWWVVKFHVLKWHGVWEKFQEKVSLSFIRFHQVSLKEAKWLKLFIFGFCSFPRQNGPKVSVQNKKKIPQQNHNFLVNVRFPNGVLRFFPKFPCSWYFVSSDALNTPPTALRVKILHYYIYAPHSLTLTYSLRYQCAHPYENMVNAA